MTRRIDPYSIRLFVRTANEGSIARAAAAEHIAASALSRRINDLEQFFEVPLLIRSPHGIALTQAGHLVHRRGVEIESELDALLREVQSLDVEVRGRVRLHANASSVIGFLPERLQLFGTRYPRVAVELQERLSEDVVRACLDDAADVGIGAQGAVPPGLESWHFASDPLVVVMSLRHPLAQLEGIRLEEVARYPIVMVQESGVLGRSLHAHAKSANLVLRVAVGVSSFDAACRMVEAGLGVAVMPTSSTTAYAGSHRFERRPLHEPWVDRELRLYALRKLPRPAAVAALIEVLKGCA